MLFVALSFSSLLFLLLLQSDDIYTVYVCFARLICSLLNQPFPASLPRTYIFMNSYIQREIYSHENKHHTPSKFTKHESANTNDRSMSNKKAKFRLFVCCLL